MRPAFERRPHLGRSAIWNPSALTGKSPDLVE
jgi:hypothetical protein